MYFVKEKKIPFMVPLCLSHENKQDSKSKSRKI
jgi:hypothetical protein